MILDSLLKLLLRWFGQLWSPSFCLSSSSFLKYFSSSFGLFNIWWRDMIILTPFCTVSTLPAFWARPPACALPMCFAIAWFTEPCLPLRSTPPAPANFPCDVFLVTFVVLWSTIISNPRWQIYGNLLAIVVSLFSPEISITFAIYMVRAMLMSPWRWRWQTLCGWSWNSSPGTPEVWTPRPANVKDGSWTGSSSYGGSVLGIPQYSSSCLQNSEDLQELSASFPVLCTAKVVQRQSMHTCTGNQSAWFYVTT